RFPALGEAIPPILLSKLAPMRKRTFRAIWFFFALGLLAMTPGCESLPGVPAALFGPPPSPPPAAPQPPPKPVFADRVVVLKSKRLLQLVNNGNVFETFPVALGRAPVGPKEQEGDGRTPEGI